MTREELEQIIDQEVESVVGQQGAMPAQEPMADPEQQVEDPMSEPEQQPEGPMTEPEPQQAVPVKPQRTTAGLSDEEVQEALKARKKDKKKQSNTSP